MALLTVQNIAKNGSEVTLVAAAAGGDTANVTSFEAGGWDHGQVAAVVRNAGVAAITVTPDGGVAVPVGIDGVTVIPLTSGYSGRTASLTYSGVTSVGVAFIRVP